MQLAGNKPWQDFYTNHAENKMLGRSFDDTTIKERYDCNVGEEWKERLTAKVEGTEYVPGAKPKVPAATGSATPSVQGSRSQTPLGRPGDSSRSESPMRGLGTGPPNSKKAQNEAFFAKMGDTNANRSAALAPSQGGKYAGFGSEPTPAKTNDDWLGEMQKDPLAGLTKGFGWLGKSAKTGLDTYIKPNVQKVGVHLFLFKSKTDHCSLPNPILQLRLV